MREREGEKNEMTFCCTKAKLRESFIRMSEN